MKPPRVHSGAALLLLCLALWLPGLFFLPATDRDESRFAQATRQMVETSDYVRILNGREPRNRKPIGIHWLQAPGVLAACALGAPASAIWPYRLPSLVGGIVAALGTRAIGLALGFAPETAWLAGAMLAGSLVLDAETHIAKTDAALLGATVLAMLGLARAAAGRARGRDAALFWLALAAGILIKGPVAPMVLGLAVLTLCVAERRLRWLGGLRPAWGIPLLLLLVLPWFVAIGLATHGRFFAQAVGGDLGRKLAGGDDAHGGPPGLHVLLLPLLAFPATVPVLRGLLPAWRARAEPATRFLLAWALPAWLVFEAVPTKLPHYTLPLYPALMLAGARFGRAPGRAVLARAALLLVGGMVAAGAAALPFLLRGPLWLGLPAALAAILVTALALLDRLRAALLAMPVLVAALLGLELPGLPALWIAPRAAALLRQADPAAANGAGVAAAGFAEPSLMFATGARLSLLPDGPAAAQEALSGRVRDLFITADQVSAFRAGLGQTRAVLAGSVRGYNVSRGRWTTLNLFRILPPSGGDARRP